MWAGSGRSEQEASECGSSWGSTAGGTRGAVCTGSLRGREEGTVFLFTAACAVPITPASPRFLVEEEHRGGGVLAPGASLPKKGAWGGSVGLGEMMSTDFAGEPR